LKENAVSGKETPYSKGKKMLEGVVETLRGKKEYLNRLDAEIGDGDHGRTVFEVFEKALDKIKLEEKDSDVGTLLKEVGRTIAFSGGAATGPLFGTAFIEAGKTIEGKSEIKLEDWSRAVKAAEEGIKKRGRAQVGEKTMLDTIHSVSESLQKSVDQKESLEKALINAEKAARQGLESTKDIVSRRGRSSRLGERTKGHLDPGAASSYYILKSIIKDCIEG
jgi:dihydroxyacetone kinase-like protein